MTDVLRLLDGLAHHEALDTIRLLRQADTFAWSADAASAVMMASRTIPRWTTLSSETFPAQSGWWWFDRPVPIRTTANQSQREIAAILWGFQSDGQFRIESVIEHNGVVAPSLSTTWEIGSSLSNLIESSQKSYRTQEQLEPGRLAAAVDGVEQMCRFVLAGFAWLQQRIVTTSNGPVERHTRKQMARESGMRVISDVKVIQLRRPEVRKSDSESADGAAEWSCRWIVNGHWRNQPYKNERKLIYILPYVKGPDDKPLKVPTHTVYAVNR